MPAFYCPKCKRPGMVVDARPSVTQHFAKDGQLFDYDFSDGPGTYEDDDRAYCPDCDFTGHPADFEHEEDSL